MKTAIITGIMGQDASYLSEHLLTNGYKVIGLRRRSANPNYVNIRHLMENPYFQVEICDITDASSVCSILSAFKPDEFYNLAAQSHVQVSFSNPIATFEANAVAVTNVLEAIRQFSPTTKLYQASTSEMFGKSFSVDSATITTSVELNEHDLSCSNYSKEIILDKFQDEDTPFAPQSPYAVAKVAAHQMCQLYRRAYGLHISCGILFNHESPRRGKEFVTRKVTDYVGRLINQACQPILCDSGILGDEKDMYVLYNQVSEFPKLKLGNLDAKRDWGHARDYMEAAHMMLQQPEGDDYVIATGETHTIRELCEVAFNQVGLKWEDFVEVDQAFVRPAEVDYLLGSAEKAKEKLGWTPKTTFKALIEEMVDASIKEHHG